MRSRVFNRPVEWMLLGVVMAAVPGVASDVVSRPGLESIERARINLNPVGAKLGFEHEVAGNHRAVAALVELIDHASPGDDHKCSNIGAVRLFREDGGVVGVGLLPGHVEGLMNLRLYEDGSYLGVVEVDRDRLEAVLAMFGVAEEESIMRASLP